jgi:signal transduction histidine kinase
MPGRYGRARVRHVGRRAHLRYRIRLNRPGPHPRYVRRIARADDGIAAGRDDNEQVADEETSGRPGSARGLADFFRQSEERPVASRAARAADAAIATVGTIAALITATVQARHAGAEIVYAHPAGFVVRPFGLPPPWPSAWVLLGVALTVAPLAFRRIYPIAAFCVILVAVIATSRESTTITFVAVILAAYSAVVYSAFRRLALLTVLAGAAMVTAAYPNTTPPVPERYTALLILLPTVSVAMAIRLWRRRAGESAERLRVAEQEHEAQTRHAVALERARIASEMHDVVTHNVSVMVVQAGAARRVLDSSPGEAREALLAVEASGRTAMTELRHLLGLLAPAGDAEPGPAEADALGGAAGPADAALTPQPGVARIPALLSRLCAAGMPVELSIDATAGSPRALPPGIDLAAFRVVQEGLTNVMKHAGQTRTTVHLEYRPRDLLITVCDDGRPPEVGPPVAAPVAAPGAGVGPGVGPGPEAAPRPETGPGPGARGLIGLRERLAVYGGELDAGPRPGGGWRLAARIPLEPAAGDLPVPLPFETAPT